MLVKTLSERDRIGSLFIKYFVIYNTLVLASWCSFEVTKKYRSVNCNFTVFINAEHCYCTMKSKYTFFLCNLTS